MKYGGASRVVPHIIVTATQMDFVFTFIWRTDFSKVQPCNTAFLYLYQYWLQCSLFPRFSGSLVLPSRGTYQRRYFSPWIETIFLWAFRSELRIWKRGPLSEHNLKLYCLMLPFGLKGMIYYSHWKNWEQVKFLQFQKISHLYIIMICAEESKVINWVKSIDEELSINRGCESHENTHILVVAFGCVLPAFAIYWALLFEIQPHLSPMLAGLSYLWF